MKHTFGEQLNSLIEQSDIVLEVLDARFPEKTRNRTIENRATEKGKSLVLAINKADLAERKKIKDEKEKIIEESAARVVFVSAKEKNGIRLLKREIKMASPKKGEVTVGMLGYPNSGKSTLINALSGKGKGKVRVSAKAGFTKGLQKIKIGEGLYLIDAPGIIPLGEKDEFELFLVGAKNANQLKDVEGSALKLISGLGISRIAEKFGLGNFEGDEEELLEKIAQKKNWLASGGKANASKAGRELLEKYQKNEL